MTGGSHALPEPPRHPAGLPFCLARLRGLVPRAGSN